MLAMVTYGSKVGNDDSNLWELAVPDNGNLWFQGCELGVPTSGNRQFLAMITGSQVRNEEFQPNGNPWFPAWELAVLNLGTRLLSKTKRSVPNQ